MEQRLGKQHDQKHGYEVLHTDSADRRSAQWFTQTGKAFATGVASKCIACASCPTNRVVFSDF